MGTSRTGQARGKLTAGMRVHLYYPRWRLSCRVCETFLFSSRGELMRDPSTGEPYERGPTQATPCVSCPKVPGWAKSAGKDWRELRRLAEEMTAQNRQALEFYYQCKATGRFPADPLVEWYSGIFRRCEDEYGSDQQAASTIHSRTLTELMVTVLTKRR